MWSILKKEEEEEEEEEERILKRSRWFLEEQKIDQCKLQRRSIKIKQSALQQN